MARAGAEEEVGRRLKIKVKMKIKSGVLVWGKRRGNVGERGEAGRGRRLFTREPLVRF